MKACFLLPAHWSGTVGGAEIQVRYILDALQRRSGVDLYYLCRRTTVSDDRGVRVLNVGAGGPLAKYMHLVDWWKVDGLLREIRPDVIYARVDSPYLGMAAWYRRRHGCRLIWHIANERDVRPSRLDSWRSLVRYGDRRLFEYGVRHSDTIIGQADYQDRLLEEHFGRNCTAIIPNFHPAPPACRKPAAPKRVVWVGSIKPNKHPERFLDLARRLAADTRVEFLMVGPIQDRDWEACLPDVVSGMANLTYLGQQPHDRVVELLGTAHVLVSTGEVEGFPNVFIEAWLNRAVVVSFGIDPDDVLSNHQLGLLSGNEDQLVRDVLKLVEDEPTWKEMSERGYQYALDTHSLDNAERVADFFFP